MAKLKVFSVWLICFFFVACFTVLPQQKESEINLLIRCDDIGMSHAVNMAAAELMKTKIPFSASVMIVCPWYQEGIELLKEHPEVTAGIHLTLNAEWKNYRWGPITGRDAVPSLIDSCGYFFPSRSKLYAHNPKVDEVEKELRAQIERAVNTGLKFYYVDYHMGTAVDKPENRAVVEKLAKEYNLAISRYFGEVDTKNVYDVPVGSKADSMAAIISRLTADKMNLLVCHIGTDTPELQAMIDLNPTGPKNMSKHRQDELNALLSDKTNSMIKQKNIHLMNYGELIKERGLENMKRPVE